MPTLPFTRRQLRHAAYLTLFAWIFGLLSGVANACLTQPNAQAGLRSISLQADQAVEGAAGPVTRQVEHSHHHGEDDDDGLGRHSAKEGCLKLCAVQSSAVTKSKAPHSDLPSPDFVASVRWPSPVPSAAASDWTRVERPASVGPPLFIRLLRLTI